VLSFAWDYSRFLPGFPMRSTLRARKAFTATGEVALATATAITQMHVGHIKLLLFDLFAGG
jgi:hypothetical protein